MRFSPSLFFRFLLLLTLLWPSTPVQAQGSDPMARAARTLRALSPEERVGQLFLVTFSGSTADPDSQIYDLIARHHVGGVVLTAANDNFVAAPDTTTQAQSLVSMLQQAETDAAFSTTNSSTSTYIPLFVAVSQEGGVSNDQIFSGLTPLPNQMAIGATWDPATSAAVGKVMGRELAALGFNLYLGLSLDVLSTPNPALPADLSTRVFGGDPFWVGELGRSYLSGLRDGSEGHMAVVARHFPGRGGSDRSPEQEVATVRRSLEELKQIELAPFFSVTDPNADIDGLLVSHIRYQGFQGNIRATTRPISFDSQALTQILALPQFSTWRSGGGLLLSDDLGTPAVRRFYDPSQQSFTARLIARDAFLAGNDLLYMGNIVSSDMEDNYTTMLRVLEFFAQKYREDPAFAQRVDESVLRILALKHRLYPNFTLQPVKLDPANLSILNQSSSVTFDVARQAATLFSPTQADFSSTLPGPPSRWDYMVFITDSRQVQQCSTCAVQDVLPVNALQNAVLTLYGPKTGALVDSSHLSSYSFDDLALYLNNQAPEDSQLQNDLRRASWIVFSTLDLSEGQDHSRAFRRLFSERQSLLMNKRLILFSFGAPYYLDATDISNLTAYYGMYSQSPPFIEMAARLLFQELSPLGASPVSIPGLGYDLISATSPDPRQVISLMVDTPSVSIPTAQASGVSTLEATAEPIYRVGDSLALRTGVIVDHNGKPVPDGTIVRFTLSQGDGGFSQQQEIESVQGVARATFRLDKPGLMQVSVSSEPAVSSNLLQLNVTNEGATIIIITPTAEPTLRPTETVIPTPSPAPAEGPPVVADGSPTFLGWILAMLALFAGVFLIYWVGAQLADSRWAVRWALLALLCSLLAYNYFALNMPGAQEWAQAQGLVAFLQAILLGQLVGILIGLLWRSISPRQGGL